MPLPIIEFRFQEYLLRLSVTLTNSFYELSLETKQPIQNIELDQTQVERFQKTLFRMLYIARRVGRFEYTRVRQHTGTKLAYYQQAFRQRYELHQAWRNKQCEPITLIRLQALTQTLTEIETLIDESIRLEAHLELQATKSTRNLSAVVKNLFAHESRLAEQVALYDYCVAKARMRYQALFPKGVLFP